MSDAVIIAIVAALPPTLMALAALLQGLRNYRQGSAIRRDVNGRLEQLLQETAGRHHAEGQLVGQRSVVIPPPMAPVTAILPNAPPAPPAGPPPA